MVVFGADQWAHMLPLHGRMSTVGVDGCNNKYMLLMVIYPFILTIYLHNCFDLILNLFNAYISISSLVFGYLIDFLKVQIFVCSILQVLARGLYTTSY